MKIILFFLSFVLIQFLGISYAEIDGEELKINRILSLNIQSAITPATFGYLKEGFKKAQSQKYDLIQISLNTPGGLVSTTKKILTLFGESNIPVAVWIRPEGSSATSAGAIIASGAHILMMSDGTNIGAATPIEMSGDIKSKDLRSKAINDLVALVSSLAKTRGRNALLFSDMISKASSFESQEAKKKKLIDAIANTQFQFIKKLENLTVKLKGKEYTTKTQSPEVTEFKMDLGLSLLEIFANPGTAYILFVIGAALMYLELQAPGGLIAGSIGAICLVLAGIGFQVLPLNMGALGLIILSFVLFIIEVYITSYGILSIGGLIALVSGSLFLFRTDDAYIELSRTLIFSTTAAIVLFLALIAYYMIRDQKNIGVSKFNSLVGARGEILNFVDEDNNMFIYQMKVNGEIWKVASSIELTIGDHYTVKEKKENSMILII
jgi:membrane-bound serine protease (ClpP class)